LTVLSDWAAALTKLWVLFHPAKQSWLNRGGRTLNSTRGSAFYGLRNGFAHYLYASSCVAVVVLTGIFIGLLPVWRESHLFLTAYAQTVNGDNQAPPSSMGRLAQPGASSTHLEPKQLSQISPAVSRVKAEPSTQGRSNARPKSLRTASHEPND
jgi:hypothetical protein